MVMVMMMTMMMRITVLIMNNTDAIEKRVCSGWSANSALSD